MAAWRDESSPTLVCMLALVIVCGACGRAPIASCDEDLTGVYDAGGSRWMILDNGPTLEAYPLFPDLRTGDVLAAPRVLDLHRPELIGDVKRRYTRGGDHCTMRAPARLTACTNDRLELVLADPAAPLALPDCGGPPAETHVERWVHQ